MDGSKFDSLIRSFATGTSRRRLIKGIGGGAIAGALAHAGLQRGSAEDDCPEKVGICHRTNSAKNPFNYIEVCIDAVPAHEAHGDLVSCPGAGFIDPETCTCECDLACDGNFDLDEAACACVCALTEVECPSGVDLETCECLCDLTCEGNFELDEAACECVCSLTEADCPAPLRLDPAICACVGGEETCPAETFFCGSEIDQCGVGAGPLPECVCFSTSEGTTRCGNNYLCANSQACDTTSECEAAFGPGFFCSSNCCDPTFGGRMSCTPPCGISIDVTFNIQSDEAEGPTAIG